MTRILEIIKKSFCLAGALVLGLQGAYAQEKAGALGGRLTDELGGVIVGARVTVIDAKAGERTATTNEQGSYLIDALPPGSYTVRVAAEGFAPYEKREVEVASGRREVLDIKLTVAIVTREVTVDSDSPTLSANPGMTANTIVLKRKELDALPDDPDDLAAALQAMAGGPAGPNGGQLYVDGFAGGSLPAKISIREVRINQNPIAAENDSPGVGRIDIYTQPGTDTFHGSAFFSLIDGRWNARNPFSTNKLPFQRRQIEATLSGRVIPKRLSFSVDFQRQDQGDSQLISATILDEATLNVLPLRVNVLTPREITSFSPRLDYQLSTNHTLTARYNFSRTTSENRGVGGFNLPSRAFDLSTQQHILRLTETAVLSPSVINETRFQYLRDRRDTKGDDSQPAITVLEAFSGGGSQVGLSNTATDHWELQNYTTRAFHAHTLKFGMRLRGVRVADVSGNNFGGTFIYSGGLAPVLDDQSQVVANQFELISSIERYRRTQLFLRQGLTVDELRLRGGGATQFSIATGDRRATTTQVDFGGFIQDDWRFRPNLTLSFGLRYENQNHISSNLNFGPRLGFAWAPGTSSDTRPPRTVIRGGVGLFYERYGEDLDLQTRRFNGQNQLSLIVNNPDFLTVPPVAVLQADALKSQIVRRLAEDFQSPYSLFSAIQVERQLPKRITLSVLFYNVRSVHVLRQRDINAPLPGTFVVGDPAGAVRPLAEAGELFLYESSGTANENHLQVVANGRLSAQVTCFATYDLAKAEADAEGNFPANSYDLSGEYGPASTDLRHRFVMGGVMSVPKLNVNLTPFVIVRSGLPFNITTGRDTNGDTLFTERPAFATDLSRPSVVETRFGNFDLSPLPDQQIIPRNFGRGPSLFSVNLGLSKSFGFDRFGGKRKDTRAKGPAVLIPGSGKRASRESRYRLQLSMNAENLFNHTNGAVPVGNLSSTLFGQSISSAGPFGGGVLQSSNRRLRAQVRFEF